MCVCVCVGIYFHYLVRFGLFFFMDARPIAVRSPLRYQKKNKQTAPLRSTKEIELKKRSKTR